MPDLPVRSAPVVGLPSRWAADLAVGGALLPYAALLPLTMLSPVPMPQALWSELLSLSLATGLLGTVLGAASPLLLDKLRGQVPLSLLALLASTATTTAMLVATWLASSPSMLALLWVVLGAGLGTLLWLPYLVLTALDRPTWPVLLAGLMGSPIVSWALYVLAQILR